MDIHLDVDSAVTLLVEGVDQLGMGFAVFDRDGVLVAANQQFQTLLNLPGALCRPGATMEQALRHNADVGEYAAGKAREWVRPDGAVLEVRSQSLPSGGMVFTYLDITERHASEQALRLEYERLRNILKGTNAGSWEFNLQTGVLLANERWASMIGYTVAELEPITTQLMRHLCHPDDLPAVDHAVAQHIKGQTEYYRCEHRIQHRKGHWIWVTAYGQISARTADGKVLTIAGAHLDVTEHKLSEMLVQELNETLEERVAERTLQLSQALHTLHQSQTALAHSAAKATLGTLVASVTHELNTPLGNSLMAASTCADLSKHFLAQIEAGQVKRSDLNTFVAEILEGSDLAERNLHRAVELVKNFKQVAADQASEQRRSFDLESVVKEVLDTLRPSLKRFSHRVQVDIAQKIEVDGYPGAFGQVLINLINNAYLHAFEGRENGCVQIEARASDGWVELRVEDDGVGMSEELLKQLFQPFFSTKIGRGGTGLGMTIVDNLVQKTMGGVMKVSSEVGKGSSFHIRMPQVAPSHNDIGLDSAA